MSVVSKKKSWAQAHKARDSFITQAVKELSPRWERVKSEFEGYKWGWEFLCRNEEYIIGSKAIEREEDEWCRSEKAVTFVLAASALMPEQVRDSFLSLPELDRRKICWRNYHNRPKEAVRKFGLSYWLRPDEEMLSPLCWNKELVGKHFSESCLHNSYDWEEQEIRYSPTADEEIMVINFNTPYQAFLADIKERYERRGLKTTLPQFQESKFLNYLKVYDLREWGKKNDPAGTRKSCISWSDIGRHLSPRAPMSVQAVRKQYAAALKLINGGYKELVKYKY